MNPYHKRYDVTTIVRTAWEYLLNDSSCLQLKLISGNFKQRPIDCCWLNVENSIYKTRTHTNSTISKRYTDPEIQT